MRAIMLAFACRQQYHVLRAAAAAGYSVHVAGKDCARGLKYSRYCSSYHQFDFDPLTQSLDDALGEINRLVKNLSADLILPSDIISTRLLAALAGRLPVPTCALPDTECFDTLNDKWRFYRFCTEHGVRVPQTWLFEDTGQLKEAVLAGTVPFPFIVKPHDFMGGLNILRIADQSGLKLLDGLKYKPLLVQKLIIGDEVDISTLSNGGRIGAYAIQRNLPDKYIFVRNDQLLAEASRIVEASKFNGLAHFDAIMERASGNVYMIECNPRAWYSIFASTIAGLNFIKMSLDPGSLDLVNPQCIVDKEVPADKFSVKALVQLMTKFSFSKTYCGFLKYTLADFTGRVLAWRALPDDSRLMPGSAGSVENQVEALAAISAMTAFIP